MSEREKAEMAAFYFCVDTEPKGKGGDHARLLAKLADLIERERASARVEGYQAGVEAAARVCDEHGDRSQRWRDDHAKGPEFAREQAIAAVNIAKAIRALAKEPK